MKKVIGNCTLYNGDCLEVMLELISDAVKVDAVISSPPYNKKFFCPSKIKNAIWGRHTIDYKEYQDNLPIKEYEKWMVDFLNTALLLIKKDGSLFF